MLLSPPLDLEPDSADTRLDEAQELALLDLVFDTTSTAIKLEPRKMASASPSNNLRGFFKLPPELRLQIYEEVFCVAPFNPNTPRSPSLLTACKLIRHEAWLIYKAHLMCCMNHYRMPIIVTSNLVQRAGDAATTYRDYIKIFTIHKAVIRVGMEHERVYEAERIKLVLGPQVGGEFTLEEKVELLMKLERLGELKEELERLDS